MEKIIKKAIEGGWKEMYPAECSWNQYDHILLDPLFWQCLEKGAKWNTHIWLSTFTNLGRYTENPQVKKPRWFIEAMNFHEINLTESFDKAVEYLLTLI